MCGRAPTEKKRAIEREERSNVSSMYSNNQNFSIIKGEMSADGNSVKLQPLFFQPQLQRRCENVGTSIISEPCCEVGIFFVVFCFL